MANRSFTLIELLVVVAIIGLLASSVVANLSIARARARDARRKADLKTLQTALEVYLAEKDSYPSTLGIAGCTGAATSAGTPFCGEPSGFGAKGYQGANGYIPNLAPEYVSLLPSDPTAGMASAFATAKHQSCSAEQAGYLYASNGSDYKLVANCTIETAVDPASPFYDAIRPNWAFSIATPGARGW